MDGVISVEVRDRIGGVTIDRPERRNTLGQATTNALVEAFDSLVQYDDSWAVLLTGKGDAAFGAGRDLKELADRDAARDGAHLPMKGPYRNAFAAAYECGMPTVAAINGWAVGGGLELVMACDLRGAAAHARLGLADARRGIGANFGAAILPRIVAPGVAAELLFFDDGIPADQALVIGLVNRVFPSETFWEKSETYVQELLRRAPLTIQRYKQVLQWTMELPLSASIHVSLRPGPDVSEDRVEDVRAFVEKREPQWRAR